LSGADQPAGLKIVTVAENQDAERWREQFATMTRDEIERENLARLEKYYPDIQPGAPITLTDDERRNQVEVDEFYVVPKIWIHLPEQNYLLQCHIYPANVQAAMQPPALIQRSMPFGAEFPEHEIFHAEISMPTLPLMTPDDQTIENPAFYFHRLATITGG